MIATVTHIGHTGTTTTDWNDVDLGDTSIIYIDDWDGQEYQMEYESVSYMVYDYQRDWSLKFVEKFYRDENALNTLMSICKGYKAPSQRISHQKPHRVLRMMFCNRT